MQTVKSKLVCCRAVTLEFALCTKKMCPFLKIHVGIYPYLLCVLEGEKRYVLLLAYVYWNET